jgi:hypothetical protein
MENVHWQMVNALATLSVASFLAADALRAADQDNLAQDA